MVSSVGICFPSLGRLSLFNMSAHKIKQHTQVNCFLFRPFTDFLSPAHLNKKQWLTWTPGMCGPPFYVSLSFARPFTFQSSDTPTCGVQRNGEIGQK